jgi:cytidine deaminase
VHCAGAEGGEMASYRLSDLLPDAFGPGDLGIA